MPTLAAAAPSVTAAGSRTRFFIGFAAATLALVVVGFARTFYLRPLFGVLDTPTDSPTLPWHLTLHGIVMSAWFAFVLMQTVLVSTRNVRLHRRLGYGGAGLAVLLILVAMYTLVEFLARRDARGIPTGDQQYGVVLGDTLVILGYFPALIAAGLYLRRDVAAHKRLMLLSSMVMLGPVLARYGAIFRPAGLSGYWLVLVSPIPLLLALFTYDFFTRRRPHWATLCGAAMVALYVPIRNGLLQTAPAMAYIEWLRHLK